MRIFTLLAIVVFLLAGGSAESFAGIIAPQRQAAKKFDNRSAQTLPATRPQVRNLLTSTPSYRR